MQKDRIGYTEALSWVLTGSCLAECCQGHLSVDVLPECARQTLWGLARRVSHSSRHLSECIVVATGPDLDRAQILGKDSLRSKV